MGASNIAAFFDFDNTLLIKDGAEVGLKFLWARGEISVPFLLKTGLLNKLFKHNLISSDRMAEVVLQVYRNRPLSEFEANIDSYYKLLIQPMLSPPVMQKVEWHREQGHRLVILSASPRYILLPVMNDLAFDHLLCTELEMGSDGLLTGRSQGPPCIGVHKGDYALELAKQEGLDLSASYAYGDHHSDLSILERVGHPVAVEPTPILQRVAESRSWSVIWHKDSPVVQEEA